MGKVKFFWNYPIDIDIETDKDVEVYIDKFCPGVVPPDVIRILQLQEPFRNSLFNFAINHPDRYTHLLTYQEEILGHNPKAIKFMATNTWIYNYSFPEKKFCISALVGGKTNETLFGYEIRHQLWWSKELITNPSEIYLSSHYRWNIINYETQQLILGNEKEPLFNSQFHITIENISQRNMFTEKLIDCLQTKTVPIYYGCRNVEDYFNIDGILVANNLKEIIDVSNSVTPDTYRKMLPAIEDNLERSKKYINYKESLRQKIIELIT